MAGNFETVADAGPAVQAPPAVTDRHPDINDLLAKQLHVRVGDPASGLSNYKSTDLTLTGITLPPTQIAHPDAPKLPTQTAAPGPAETGLGGLDTLQAPPKNTDQSSETESKWNKVGRETVVIGGGLGKSFLYGMASLPERVPQIASSVAIGASLSTISKAGELGTAATIVVGAYFTSKFIVNAINDTPRWNKLSTAVSDTWNSNQHLMKNLNDASDSGGNFAFDTSLSYASGYIGYKNEALAELILKVIKLPLPVPAGIPPKFPLTPALIGAAPYLASVPAPFLYNHHHEDDASRKAGDN
jgi:hypothetical protein